MRIALFLVVSLCLPIITSAETAERMLSARKGVSEAKWTDDVYIDLPVDMDTGMCWGSFSVLDTVFRLADVIKPATPTSPAVIHPVLKVCFAEKHISLTQEVAIFMECAKHNPQQLHEDFFFVARDALRAAFPCPESVK